jgi:hypothetical protein
MYLLSANTLNIRIPHTCLKIGRTWLLKPPRRSPGGAISALQLLVLFFPGGPQVLGTAQLLVEAVAAQVLVVEGVVGGVLPAPVG